ncbi:MAG: NAD(P)/FAD-dependent oxidoreductase, partial [Chloroflexi bacterium]|nr:NAD(P)/FAD-dependent oxidoreductase [Chloroflexota bacterium]
MGDELMPQDREYDGVIIGAGHNGLILEGYMARAGLEVVAAERHLEVGGGLDAHENPELPGFWHNAHSINHRGRVGLPWFRDLEMARWGSEYIQPDPWYTLILSDRRALVWWKDPEQTAASIARFSERDAKAFLDMNKRFVKAAQQIMAPETYSPPLPAARKRELLEGTEAGREYFEWAKLSLIEAVQELFSDPSVQAFVLYIMLIRGSEIDQPGLGYQIPGVIAAGISASLAKGTSHRTAQVLNKSVVASGGDVIEARAVTRIVVENGRAVGVELVDGSRIRARKFVASSLNPQQTFLDLVGEEHLDHGFAERVRNFKYSTSTPILSVHLALNNAPDDLAASYDPIVNKAWLIGLGVDELKDIIS